MRFVHILGPGFDGAIPVEYEISKAVINRLAFVNLHTTQIMRSMPDEDIGSGVNGRMCKDRQKIRRLFAGSASLARVNIHHDVIRLSLRASHPSEDLFQVQLVHLVCGRAWPRSNLEQSAEEIQNLAGSLRTRHSERVGQRLQLPAHFRQLVEGGLAYLYGLGRPERRQSRTAPYFPSRIRRPRTRNKR